MMNIFSKLFGKKKQQVDSANVKVRMVGGNSDKRRMNFLDVDNSLFIIPVEFGEVDEISEPDYDLHFGEKEVQMFVSGIEISCMDLPEKFVPATEISKEKMHYRTIMGRDGASYMPLFTSYNALVSIFGENVRIGVISYETAMAFCINENFAGVILSPGVLNHLIPRRNNS